MTDHATPGRIGAREVLEDGAAELGQPHIGASRPPTQKALL